VGERQAAAAAVERRATMILKITEIEANAEELKQCNSLSDGLTAMLKTLFSNYHTYTEPDNEEDE
jgi:hypothetical protein